MAGAGFAIMVLGSTLRSGGLAVVGFLILVLGLLAMAGSRRAARRSGAVQAGLASIDQMSGTQFELMLVSFFTQAGYRVTHVGGRGDFGADLLLDGPDGRTVVQAKRWNGVVRHEAVQEAVAAMAHHRANKAMVVTNSTYSEHARKLAQSNGVVLWGREELSRELARASGAPAPSAGSHFASELKAGAGIVATFFGAFLVASATSSRRRSGRRKR